MILRYALTVRVAKAVQLSNRERGKLKRIVRSRSASKRLVERSQMVLLADEGLANLEIARRLNTNVMKVGRWRARFVEHGIEGIEVDAYRPGRFPAVAQDVVERVVDLTTNKVPEGATHWSAARLAKQVGISESSVLRIWRRFGIKPHQVRTFKVSNDPQFAEKLEEIVGLYLNPPEHAIVFSLDEKSQIQALDRTQPGLPLTRGRCATMTHEYKRNGTTTLFAALNTLDGTVIGTCMKRHRHTEWLKFLRLIDQTTPADKQIHCIADNYATHKHPAVKRWLARHPRFHMHFTPTGSSWLNMVERFFRDLTTQSIRRGVFHSVDALIATIKEHLRVHNADPKPIIWTKSAKDILEKVMRARSKIQTIQSA